MSHFFWTGNMTERRKVSGIQKDTVDLEKEVLAGKKAQYQGRRSGVILEVLTILDD